MILSLGVAGVGAAVREPVVAGTFYPANPQDLKKMVTDHLAQVPAEERVDGQLIALVVPHAGLIYSGQVAAFGHRLLENSGVNKVILCGPSHQFGFRGLSVYGPGIIWKTPLGEVPCDDSLCNILIASDKSISVIPEAHAKEHCLEVELPYLQTVLGDFKIVPVIMGYPDKSTIDVLAAALGSLPFDDKTVLIASTDWQHYRPASIGGKMDSLGMKCLANLDVDGLEKNLEEGKVEMCGGAPAVAVIRAAIARGADKVKILKYGDSGDVSGDKNSVVGYVAAALYKSNGKRQESVKKAEEKGKTSVSNDADLIGKYNLDAANKRQLLKIARESIVAYLKNGSIPEFEAGEDLQKFGAAFVTLEEQGMLRGCIGRTTAEGPLAKTVSYCAVQAAVSDPRFPPITADEVGKLHIEISVLSAMQKINSFEEIKVGRDGLMIFKGSNRGLLLPQVATDYGWNTTEFLEQTSNKAGLDKDAYKSPDAIIYKFQAVVFGE